MASDVRRLVHDLNNITLVISGHAQRMDEIIGPSHPVREDLDAILEASRRLAALGRELAAAAPAAQPPPLDPPPVSAPAPPARIFLVEDEPTVLEMLRQVLTRRGHHIDVAGTGSEALALCDSLEPPDLLIADLLLPGATGPEVARRLRARAPRARVLFMSGDIDHPLLEESRAAGDRCIAKPFTVAAFTRAVEEALIRS